MFSPILAAIGLDDVIRIVVVVVFFLAPIISQIGKSAKKEQKPKGRNRPGRQPRPIEPRPGEPLRQPEPMAHVPQQPKPAGADLQDSLQAEIDDFLRRKGGAAPKAEAAPKKQPRFEVLRPDADTQSAPQKPPLVSAPETPKTIDRAPLRGESVADHVREHLDTDDFARRSEHMADELEHADEKLEAHLKDVFQHTIGKLSNQSTAAEGGLQQGTDASVWESTTERAQHKRDAADKRASDLISMLRDPVNVRSSIILSEIIRRPSFDELDRKSKS